MKVRGGNVTFGKEYPTRIRGKGTIFLKKGKTKSQNELFFDGIKHNLPSVSQMCDQGYNVAFHSTSCELMKFDS